MMNYIKHSKQNLTKLIVFSSAILLLSCTEESKKEKFVARVNNSYLTREEFALMVDTTKLTPSEREQTIEDWIYRELLFQNAKRKKILDKKEYKSIIEASNKELAAALLLDDYVTDKEINLSEDDIINYYERNKNYFQLNIDSYLINKVTFKSEDVAIDFRSLAVESGWVKAQNFFSSDSNMISNINSELVSENNLYPVQLMKITKDLFPQEISIVINDGKGRYSVLQLLGKYPKGVVPQLQLIKPLVEDRLLSEKKKELVNSYLKELYSKNEIEIRK